MCGRYSIGTKPDVLAAVFKLASIPLFEARYNVAPTQLAPVIRADEKGTRRMDFLKWGFVPSWADDPAIGNRMINARSESVAEKPAFRKAFRCRRCLIPADAFYEWKKVGTRKQPFAIRAKDHQPFALAGLWECWQDKRESNAKPVESFTILTTEANELVRELHDRMPVIIEPADYDRWLDPTFDEIIELKSMLCPMAASKMVAYAVTNRINRTQYGGPECLEPVESTPVEQQGRLF